MYSLGQHINNRERIFTHILCQVWISVIWFSIDEM